MQNIINAAKQKAIEAIEADFNLIQEYFESDLSLARFATNKNMTIWQFKWLLNKHEILPKAKKYRERRKLKEMVSSFEDAHKEEDEFYEDEAVPPDSEDDFSGL